MAKENTAGQNEQELSVEKRKFLKLGLIDDYNKKFRLPMGQDGLFSDLYEVIYRLHLVMIEHLDRISTLEAKTIQQKYAKVS